MCAKQRLQCLTEHRRVKHLAIEFDGAAEKCVRFNGRFQDRNFGFDIRRRRRICDLTRVDMKRMDHLFTRHAHRGFFAGVFVDHAGLFIAVQVQPAPHIVRLHARLRHCRLADERLHAADDALASDTRLEQHLIHEVGEFYGPVAWCDVDTHRF